MSMLDQTYMVIEESVTGTKNMVGCSVSDVTQPGNSYFQHQAEFSGSLG